MHDHHLVDRAVLGWSGAAIALLLSTAILKPSPRLIWNASASAPLGLYWVSLEAEPRVGDLVVAQLPDDLGLYAAKRHYLPFGVPLVKRVAAVTPSRVCADGPRLQIDRRFAAYRLLRDGSGRLLPWWQGCHLLTSDEILLLMDNSASFDGRYFGPTSRRDVIGTATLLWRR